MDRMNHSHCHGHSHSSGTRKGLRMAFWLNTGFALIELAGGLLTRSTAILADALHDLGDSLALGLGIWMEKVSGREGNYTFTYGYKRFSLLSALILYVFLCFGSAIIILKSAAAWADPPEVHSLGMLGLAVLGLAMNGMAFLRLRNQSETQGNRNIRALMFHLLEDVLGWVAVLAGALIIYLTGWNWIDPLLSTGIASFILIVSLKRLVAVMKLFLQAAPPQIDVRDLEQQLLKLQGVEGIHDLHVWTLDGEETIGSLHLTIDPGYSSSWDDMRARVQRIFLSYSVSRLTLQLETVSSPCSQRQSTQLFPA